MASPSVSFRISRSAEDLAETIHALSQRIVKLEQRLAAMELQVVQQQQLDPQEEASFENVERLLRDCRDLLDGETEPLTAPLSPRPHLQEGEGFSSAA
ncbi:MAG: hypothetical protein ACKO6F_07285 [Cyanobium sp.]